MRTIRTAAFFLPVLATVASADELEASDVPSACTSICGPIVTLTNTCDIDRHDTRRRLLRRKPDDHGNDHVDDAADDAAEAECICKNTSFDVSTIAALCASCLGQNRGDAEDMNKIMSQCGFASTTYLPDATTAVEGVTVSATQPAVATGTGPGSSTSTPAISGAISSNGSKDFLCGLVIGVVLSGLIVAWF